jgi:hypothetical protein
MPDSPAGEFARSWDYDSGHPTAPSNGQREARSGSLLGRRDQLLFPCLPRVRAQ